MEVDPNPPGFDRLELEEEKTAIYLSRPNELGLKAGTLPRFLKNASQVSSFLAKENISGVHISQFDFVKRGKRTASTEVDAGASKVAKASDIFGDDPAEGLGSKGGQQIFNMTHLLRPAVKVEHRKELEATAAELDQFRCQQPTATDPETVSKLRLEMASAETVGEMVNLLWACEEGKQEMGKMVEDTCFQELISISAADGELPLSEWPNDRAKNWFSSVARFAKKFSPLTLSFLLCLVVHSEEQNISAENVVSLATLYGLLAAHVDKLNNVMRKLNTLQLKMDGCTEEGIDAMAALGITHTSRHLRRQRDVVAEVAHAILIEETKNHPDQSTLDNCNQKGSDTTVEYRQTETIDTSNLGTQPKNPAEVMDLFGLDLLDVTSPELQQELVHLQGVVGLVVATAVAQRRQGLAHVLPLLPRHHAHSQSDLPLEEAHITLVSPHYYKVGLFSAP